MTNIYNKNILSKDGTLIENWFEERVLRDATGEGRTVPKEHVPKKNVGEDLIINGKVQKDITSIRCLGEPKECSKTTTYQDIGNFSTKESKYVHGNIKDKVFKEFFSSYLDSKESKDSQSEALKQGYRSLDSTNSAIHKKQSIDYPGMGKRHMKTPDGFPIDQTKLDKLFMASHGMSKYHSVIPENKATEYVGSDVPYFKDKEVTFWSTNLNKGSFYTSPLQGGNAFAKSSGFTQPVSQTKNKVVTYGKIEPKPSAKGVFLDEKDAEFIESFRKFQESQNVHLGSEAEVKAKVLKTCVENGWTGVRHLRTYFLNLKKRTSTLIDLSEFKYFTVNFGIFLSDTDISLIFSKFDVKGNSEICFNAFLDWLTEVEC